MTLRQLLTRRHLAWRAGLLLCGIVPVVFYFLPWQTLIRAERPAALEEATSGPTARRTGPATEFSSHAKPVVVGTAVVRQAGPGTLTQAYTGIVTARRTTVLSAKVLGRVERVAVDIGDRIRQGDVLVQMDTDQLAAERRVTAANLHAAESVLAELRAGPRIQDIERAEAAVREATSQLELRTATHQRFNSLRASATVSAQEYDETRFALEAAKAQLRSANKALELLRAGTRDEQLQAQVATVASLTAQLDRIDVQLSDMTIVAPFDGHVQSRLLDEGAVTAPGEAILEVVETDALEVHVGLPPELTVQLSTLQLRVTVAGSEVPVVIERLAPQIDPLTRTREVVFAIQANENTEQTIDPKQDSVIPIGSAAKVELETQVDSDNHWVPTQALTAGPRGLWAVQIAVPLDSTSSADTPSDAWRLATHRIERRPVELLRAQGAWSDVRGPIGAEEWLVVEGTHLVVPGQRVTCRPISPHAVSATP